MTASRRKGWPRRSLSDLETLRQLVTEIAEGIYIMSAEHKLLDANAALLRIFGASSIDELRRYRPEELVVEPERLELERHLLAERGWLRNFEFRIRRLDGQIRTVRDTVIAQRDADGKLVTYTGILTDVTEQAELRADLEAREAQLSAFFTEAPAGLAILDRDLRFLRINQTLAQVHGLPVEAHLGSPIGEVIPCLAHHLEPVLRRVLKTGLPEVNFEFRVDTPDEADRGRHFTASCFPVGQRGAPAEAVGIIVVETTEAKWAEDRLRRESQYLAALIESNPLAIVTLDPDNRITSCNPAFEKLFRYSGSEIVGRNIDDLVVPPGEQARAKKLSSRTQAGELVRVEARRMRKDGSLVDVQLFGVPIVVAGRQVGIYGIYEDLSERKLLEQQLRHAQKMEALGTLAGGIAHDFNNLLTSILGYSDLVLAALGEESPLRADVEQIRRAGEMAAAMTRQLLGFGRPEAGQPVVFDLNEVVREMEGMLRRLLPENIDLVISLDGALRPVIADPNQIQQVVLNLAVNARDAMPDGGKLSIETANRELAPDDPRAPSSAKPGPYAMLAVADTGEGMDPETLARIFEPFFTTKEPGKGTGLGLATVYGIISQSQGFIQIDSEVGRGSRFEIYLPQPLETPAASPRREPAPAAAGSETILLVDDDLAVRALASRILERAGYRVVQASSPDEALEACAALGAPVDLLLTDIALPQMSGEECAKRLAQRYPGLRVLYMSGHGVAPARGDTGARAPHLWKPFAAGSLLQRVREALRTPPSGGPPPAPYPGNR